MDLLFPQWQGGDRPGLAAGPALARRLQPGRAWTEVSLDDPSPHEVGVLHRAALLAQAGRARDLIAAGQGTRLFTTGGDCGVELVPVAKLAGRIPDLTLLWLDGHPDLNTPEGSPSGGFQGMILRALLGQGDPELVGLVPTPLRLGQVVLAGVRDLDPPEAEYVAAHGIVQVPVETLEASPAALGDLLAARGSTRLYIHLDLDVLEPEAFGALGWPVPGGLSPEALIAVLHDLHARFEVVGGGLTEWLPGGEHFQSGRDEAVFARLWRAWRGTLTG